MVTRASGSRTAPSARTTGSARRATPASGWPPRGAASTRATSAVARRASRPPVTASTAIADGESALRHQIEDDGRDEGGDQQQLDPLADSVVTPVHRAIPRRSRRPARPPLRGHAGTAQ